MNKLTDHQRLHIRALCLLAATAVLWSFGGVLIKSVQWNPLAIAGTRSLIALPLLYFASRSGHINWSKDQILGAVAYALTVILFVSATKLTTAANAILLQYTAPVYVALFSGVFLKERVRWVDWLVIMVTFFGMFLFFVDRLSMSGKWGNVLAILSGIAFASLVLTMRRQKEAAPLGSVFLGNILTTLLCFPFMLHPMGDAASWASLLLLGIFQIGISYIFYSIAIKYVSALESILVLVIEPLLNPFWVFCFIGERPGGWAVMGGSIVILSVFIRSVFSVSEKFSK
jgi:drug/metabolite transporter (DMT)-like permease